MSKVEGRGPIDPNPHVFVHFFFRSMLKGLNDATLYSLCTSIMKNRFKLFSDCFIKKITGLRT